VQWWLVVPGILVIVVVFYDAFVTTVSAVSAGGPVTQRLGTALWRVLRRLARSPRSPLLAAAGPLVVFCMLLTWLLGLWAGWTLVFSAEATAVVHGDTGEPADAWTRVYYTGYTLYTLGLGDIEPRGAAWRVLTSAATLNGFVLLSMTVTYLIPLVMALSERRQHGMVLYGLGPRAHDLLLASWDGRSFSELSPHLRDWSHRVALTAQKYLSYPVLHFFHSPSRRAGIEPGLAALDEALLLLERGVAEEARPSEVVLRPLRTSFDRLEEVVTTFVGVRETTPPPPDLASLRSAGIPTVADEAFAAAVGEREQHRRTMATLVTDSGWSWQRHVVGPQ
jgi:hypothetical protein